MAALVYRVRVAGSTSSGKPLAWTECPLRGEPRVTLTADVAPADTFPVRMHEEAHAAQCRALGPLRYHARNLTAGGRLSLEAPGYCAGAMARLAQGEDTARVRERLFDDAQGAFPGLARGRISEALRLSCRFLAP
jgi:hypothetical protein